MILCWIFSNFSLLLALRIKNQYIFGPTCYAFFLVFIKQYSLNFNLQKIKDACTDNIVRLKKCKETTIISFFGVFFHVFVNFQSEIHFLTSFNNKWQSAFSFFTWSPKQNHHLVYNSNCWKFFGSTICVAIHYLQLVCFVDTLLVITNIQSSFYFKEFVNCVTRHVDITSCACVATSKSKETWPVSSADPKEKDINNRYSQTFKSQLLYINIVLLVKSF